ANEEMLLKAVEAYSWCREYPQSLERLYPSCSISDARPPRLIFVSERMPDAFHRKIKQLGFPDVDCVEFRLLEVDGVPAVFFESILRLRRPAATPAPAPSAESPTAGENVIAMNGPVAARATSVKLQKLLQQAVSEGSLGTPRHSEGRAPVREPASVVSMVTRQAAASAPRVERPRPEPVTLREPEPVIAAPVIAAAPVLAPQPEPLVVPAPVIVTPEPMIAMPAPVVMPSAPVIVTPEPIVLPKATTEPDADLMAQMERALASLDHALPAVAEPILTAVPALELVSEMEPVVVVEPEPILTAEPKLELVSASEPQLELAGPPPEPAVAAEPTVEFLSAGGPTVELAAAPATAVPAMAPAASQPVIPALNGTSHAVPSLSGDRVSLRSLPELSLRPSAPVAIPGPAPIPVHVATAAAEAPVTEDAGVSFKGLAAALLGPTAAPAAEATLAVAAETTEPVVAELVSGEMAQAVAELEPALTVEALINSALTAEPAAPVAPAETPAAKPEAPAAKKAEPALPLEFAGLQFPKDGVMTRQWMEFLSQMSNSK
ncbi:MAG TPA: hypothetical protein VFW70_01710, partial [Methylomirabilota bacterium]|nr:hypothetical protein [Methylomirabilota bacterium]